MRDRGLLGVGIGRSVGQRRLDAHGLRHGGEVEHRQQVHVGQAGFGERTQVLEQLAGRKAPPDRMKGQGGPQNLPKGGENV